jgi:hypothetical protein
MYQRKKEKSPLPLSNIVNKCKEMYLEVVVGVNKLRLLHLELNGFLCINISSGQKNVNICDPNLGLAFRLDRLKG